jgi:parallel beta-helix repeat protein
MFALPLLAGLALLAARGEAAEPTPTGRVYHVAADGSDTNDGAKSRPFRQIRKALSLAQKGDTILIGDGSYLGFEIKEFQGTAEAPLTLRAQGKNVDILPADDLPKARGTISIRDSAYIVVDGLRSFRARSAGVSIRFSRYITVRNGVFGDNRDWGVFTSHAENVLMENNVCYGSKREHGIYVSNSADNPTLRGNRCYGNRRCGIQLNADGGDGGDGIITGAVIENNVLYGNGEGGGAALNLDGVQDSRICNNLLYDNHANGIAAFKIDGAAGPKGLQILHNTIHMPADGRWPLKIANASGPNIVRNNILLSDNPQRSGLCCEATDLATVDSDYNLLHCVSPDDESLLSLADWQRQGHDRHSFSAPLAGLFVNPTSGDYRLAARSAAAGRGLALTGICADLAGRRRASVAALGCYEPESPRS